MGILADWQIKRDVKITPAADYDREAQIGKISYGYTSYGYDARIGYKFWLFDSISCGVINPKKFDKKMLREIDLTPVEGNPVKDTIIIPPGNCLLGETIEEFDIPRDVLCVVLGKSTYARCGVVVNVTPGEPEWRGRWTVEISNTSPLPVEIFCGEGIMQCLFFRCDGKAEAAGAALNYFLFGGSTAAAAAMLDQDTTCSVSYADKKGRYQDQKGLTAPSAVGCNPTGLTAPTVTKKE